MYILVIIRDIKDDNYKSIKNSTILNIINKGNSIRTWIIQTILLKNLNLYICRARNTNQDLIEIYIKHFMAAGPTSFFQMNSCQIVT